MPTAPELERVVPPPPVHAYRWDLDKTYLETEFDTLGQLVRTALEPPERKRTVPGTAVLLRELRAHGPRPNFVSIVSGSPRQMRARIEAKLRLDRVHWDELILKPNLSNVLRGRFRAVRGQVGYKLPALLESRSRLPSECAETLFGDDAEQDAFVYSLYADLVSGRFSPRLLPEVLRAAGAYRDQVRRTASLAQNLARADPVGRIFIHLDRRTPPARFAPYGPRVVPVYNTFQAALVLLADGHLGASSVFRVAADMVVRFEYGLLPLANSLQDLLRRGFLPAELAAALGERLRGERRHLNLLRLGPEILATFAQRVAALGEPPPPPKSGPIDYRAIAEAAAREKPKPPPEPSPWVDAD